MRRVEPRQLTFVFADSPEGGKGSRKRDECRGRPYLLRIPGQRDRRFRRKAIRDSEPRRSLIPGIPIALLCRELSLIDSTILRQSRSSQGGRPRDGS